MCTEKIHHGKRSQAIGDPAEESYRGATKTAENVFTNTTLRYDDQVPSRQRITSRRDGLSRLPNPRSKQEIDLDIVVSLVQFSTEKIRLLQRGTSNDAVLCNLREVIDGLIMKGERVVMAKRARQHAETIATILVLP